MANMRTRGSRSSQGSTGIYRANILHLSRIITVLLELDEPIHMTKLSTISCVSGKYMRSALLWLLRNKIVIKRRPTFASLWMYKINPEYKQIV